MLTARATRPYSHVFLVDSDMGLRPREFQLVDFVRLAEATNVSILGAAPYGPQMLFANGTRCAARNANCESYCDRDPKRKCAVCRQPVVEVKMPLFTGAAWAVVHELVLAPAADGDLVADTQLDMIWCDLLNHRLHGCDPRAGTNCIARVGLACAYSYATPMWHHDARAIARYMTQPPPRSATRGQNRTRKHILEQNRTRRHIFDSNTFVQHLRRRGLLDYTKMPSWRPPRSLLKSHPRRSLVNRGYLPTPKEAHATARGNTQWPRW